MPTTPTRPEIGAVIVYQPSCTFEVVDRRLVAEDRRLARSHRGLGVVEIEDRRRRAGDEIGVAVDVARRLFELRLVLGELRLGPVELGLRLAGVELISTSPAFTSAPSATSTFVDGGVEMRAQRDAGDRLRRADLVDRPWHGLARGAGDDHRHGRPCRCRASAGRGGGRQEGVDAPSQGRRPRPEKLHRGGIVGRVDADEDDGRRDQGGETTQAHAP